MISIRKNRIRKKGNSVTVELPENFPGEEVDVIVMPSDESANNKQLSEAEVTEWRNDLIRYCEQFSIDLSKHPFNRDELYDRP